MVFIVGGPNIFCEIVSFSATQIACLTPPNPDNYQAGEPQKIEVLQKLMHSAECMTEDGNCTFTYKVNYEGPTIVSVNKINFTAYEPVLLTGTFPTYDFAIIFKNKFTDKETKVVYTNASTNASVNASANGTETEISFNFP